MARFIVVATLAAFLSQVPGGHAAPKPVPPPPTPTAPSADDYEKANAAACADGHGLYIRQDPFDVGVYSNSLSTAKATGASLKIAQDFSGNKASAAIHGFAADVIYRNKCLHPASGDVHHPYVSGIVFAPWIFANGTAGGSTKQASTLKIGMSTEFEVTGTRALDLQYFQVSPYFQTDFQSEARVYGGEIDWTPYSIRGRLNAYIKGDKYVDYFWDAKLFSDVRYVGIAGNSGLKANASYGWVGEHFGIVADVLPSQFKHSLTFKAAYDAAWNTIGGGWANQFSSSLAWNFSESAALSLAYVDGTDRNTLTNSDQLTLSLNFKQ